MRLSKSHNHSAHPSRQPPTQPMASPQPHPGSPSPRPMPARDHCRPGMQSSLQALHLEEPPAGAARRPRQRPGSGSQASTPSASPPQGLPVGQQQQPSGAHILSGYASTPSPCNSMASSMASDDLDGALTCLRLSSPAVSPAQASLVSGRQALGSPPCSPQLDADSPGRSSSPAFLTPLCTVHDADDGSSTASSCSGLEGAVERLSFQSACSSERQNSGPHSKSQTPQDCSTAVASATATGAVHLALAAATCTAVGASPAAGGMTVESGAQQSGRQALELQLAATLPLPESPQPASPPQHYAAAAMQPSAASCSVLHQPEPVDCPSSDAASSGSQMHSLHAAAIMSPEREVSSQPPEQAIHITAEHASSTAADADDLAGLLANVQLSGEQPLQIVACPSPAWWSADAIRPSIQLDPISMPPATGNMQVPEAGSKGNYSPSTSLSQSDTSPTPVALHTAARRRQRVVLDSDDEASPGGATPALDHRNDVTPITTRTPGCARQLAASGSAASPCGSGSPGRAVRQQGPGAVAQQLMVHASPSQQSLSAVRRALVPDPVEDRRNQRPHSGFGSRGPATSGSSNGSVAHFGYSTRRNRQRVVSDSESPESADIVRGLAHLTLAAEALQPVHGTVPEGQSTLVRQAVGCSPHSNGIRSSRTGCGSPSGRRRPEGDAAVSGRAPDSNGPASCSSDGTTPSCSSIDSPHVAGPSGVGSADSGREGHSPAASCSSGSHQVAPTTVRRRLQGRFCLESESESDGCGLSMLSSGTQHAQHSQQPASGRAAFGRRTASRSPSVSSRHSSSLGSPGGSSAVGHHRDHEPFDHGAERQPSGPSAKGRHRGHSPSDHAARRRPEVQAWQDPEARRWIWLDAALQYSKQSSDVAPATPEADSFSCPGSDSQAHSEHPGSLRPPDGGLRPPDLPRASTSASAAPLRDPPSASAAAAPPRRPSQGQQAASSSDRDHNKGPQVLPRPVYPWDLVRTLQTWWPLSSGSPPASPPVASPRRNPSVKPAGRGLRDASLGGDPAQREVLEHCISADAVEPSQTGNAAGSQLGSPATADTVVLITDSDSDEGLGDCITWTSVRKTRPNRSRLDDVLDDDDALWIDQENAVPPTNLLRTPAPPVPATAVKPPRVPATPTAKAPATAPAKGRVRDVGLGAEVLTGAAFKKQRQALAHALFHRFNATVFDGQLPTDLEINWNAHLKTTAGLTRYTRELPSELFGETQYSARVELSIKVLDSSDKLERTLCHELCHVAAWLLDHSAKPPHGAVFKRWAAAAMRAHPHLRITTCHNYEIHAPFQWQCTRPTCARVYKRHSKSIDPAKQGCGMCKGKLVPLGKFNPDGTPAKARPANAYSLFIKDNFASAKKACPPGTPHGEVMKKLATQWKARKAA